MIPTRPENPETDLQADEIAALLDALIAGGTQHVNLEIGAETRVQTVNSTDCGKIGPCAVPSAPDPECDQI